MLQSGSAAPWYRSSRCGAESSCLEVALLTEELVGIRDSKLPPGSPHLTVHRAAWRTFVRGVKVGEFAAG
jgi:Domain of unknown function (DUF397)